MVFDSIDLKIESNEDPSFIFLEPSAHGSESHRDTLRESPAYKDIH